MLALVKSSIYFHYWLNSIASNALDFLSDIFWGQDMSTQPLAMALSDISG
jgi:hypothetical protein